MSYFKRRRLGSSDSDGNLSTGDAKDVSSDDEQRVFASGKGDDEGDLAAFETNNNRTSMDVVDTLTFWSANHQVTGTSCRSIQ